MLSNPPALIRLRGGGKRYLPQQFIHEKTLVPRQQTKITEAARRTGQWRHRELIKTCGDTMLLKLYLCLRPTDVVTKFLYYTCCEIRTLWAFTILGWRKQTLARQDGKHVLLLALVLLMSRVGWREIVTNSNVKPSILFHTNKAVQYPYHVDVHFSNETSLLWG